ncbi:MFS transporter [Sphingopyxis sp. DHUNG17]|uniref:MFS transporter n=1 Tax=Sphingopyxis jiangsuensis TaxID=2871171 RepID=UPI00191E31D7|nr:MFS transporter [Sphingopyxis lutea]MBL0770045.1 MFS transporter [Sphingopyxis lutea]
MNQRAKFVSVAILTAAVILSYIDRSALFLLISEVERDIPMSLAQQSWLLGGGFAIAYGIAAFPAGILLDRFSRRHILFWAVTGWSIFTLLSGFCTDYLSLLICRAGVGIGEAMLAPGAYSLIRSYYDGKARVRAFSTFSVGNAIGGGVALLITGVLLHYPLSLPGLQSDAAPWRAVLILIGFAGVVFAFLLLTLHEPARAVEDKTSSASIIPHLKSNRRLYLIVYAAQAAMGASLFGFMAWAPSFLIQSHGWSASYVGANFGQLQLVASLGGLAFGTIILQAFAARDAIAAVAAYGGATAFLAGSAMLGFSLLGTHQTVWVFLTLMLFCFPSLALVSALALAHITPVRLMARISSISFVLASSVGASIGPALITYSAEFASGSDRPPDLALGIAVGAGVPMLAAALLWTAYALLPKQPPTVQRLEMS